jgi:hypothetical protein
VNKKENWPELMHAYVKDVRAMPFAWGTFDCCLFTADCVKAMTGEDFAADFRGKYTDAPSAYAMLQEFAGGGVYATMEKLRPQFGWEEVPPKLAQRGDIVMVSPTVCGSDERFDGALGICVGTISLFVGENGLAGTSTIPSPGQETVIHAWRIPTRR